MTRLATIAFGAVMLCAPATAQQIDTDFSNRKGQVQTALAALGLAVAPPAYNALVFLERELPDDYGFISGQLGAWGTPLEGSQFYAEGFASFQYYTPDFAFQGAPQNVDQEVKWTSVATTVGAGWQFNLTDNLVFRPIANLSAGYVFSNSEVPVAGEPTEIVDFIAGNGVEALGFGGSLMLDYNQMFGVYQVEGRVRHSRMRQTAVGVLEDPGTDADTIVTSAIARLRQPIRGVTLAGRPVRSVSEATFASYDGDTGEILGLPWIARVGTGLEFETGLTRRYAPVRVRTMVRYVFGDDFDGIGFGAGLIF